MTDASSRSSSACATSAGSRAKRAIRSRCSATARTGATIPCSTTAGSGSAKRLFRLDTRNNVGDPWTGWLIDASFEAGGTELVSRSGPATSRSRATVRSAPRVRVRYTRLFADFTRYNRISPQSQLNFRLVVGAGFGDDALPLERRFALGGAGTLPGYDFRRPFARSRRALVQRRAGTAIPGQPGALRPHAARPGRVSPRLAHSPLRQARCRRRAALSRGPDVALVVFADGGRGWMTGPRFGEIRYPSTPFPR